MPIDFSDIHQTRIPEVNISGTVQGQSLQECVNKAIESAGAFFGEHDYAMGSLHVEPITLVNGIVLHYEARYEASAR